MSKYLRDTEKENELVSCIIRELKQNKYQKLKACLETNPVIAAKAISSTDGKTAQFAQFLFKQERKRNTSVTNLEIWCAATVYIDSKEAKELFEEITMFLSEEALNAFKKTYPETSILYGKQSGRKRIGRPDS